MPRPTATISAEIALLEAHIAALLAAGLESFSESSGDGSVSGSRLSLKDATERLEYLYIAERRSSQRGGRMRVRSLTPAHR